MRRAAAGGSARCACCMRQGRSAWRQSAGSGRRSCCQNPPSTHLPVCPTHAVPVLPGQSHVHGPSNVMHARGKPGLILGTAPRQQDRRHAALLGRSCESSAFLRCGGGAGARLDLAARTHAAGWALSGAVQARQDLIPCSAAMSGCLLPA